MTDDAGDLLEEYDDLTRDVSGSNYQLFAENLKRWFQILDSSALITGVISPMELAVNYSLWYEERAKTRSGMIGSGRLEWPVDGGKRLGLQLQMFRAFASRSLTVSAFGSLFMHRDNYDVTTAEIVRQLFDPLSRELRRNLVRAIRNGGAVQAAPAADRVVTLDHNSIAYADAVEAVDKLEDLVRGSNELEATEKAQRLGEIAAGRTLLGATVVRLGAVGATLGSAARYLLKKFVNGVVGQAVRSVWEKLSELLGSDWHLPGG